MVSPMDVALGLYQSHSGTRRATGFGLRTSDFGLGLGVWCQWQRHRLVGGRRSLPRGAQYDGAVAVLGVHLERRALLASGDHMGDRRQDGVVTRGGEGLERRKR